MFDVFAGTGDAIPSRMTNEINEATVFEAAQKVAKETGLSGVVSLSMIRQLVGKGREWIVAELPKLEAAPASIKKTAALYNVRIALEFV